MARAFEAGALCPSLRPKVGDEVRTLQPCHVATSLLGAAPTSSQALASELTMASRDAAAARRAAVASQQAPTMQFGGGGASGSATRLRLRPTVHEVGDSIGLRRKWDNWIKTTTLGKSGESFFCSDPANPATAPLRDTAHPEIRFNFPVTNVHVTLKDLGKAGDADARERIIWDADYGKNAKGMMQVDRNMPSEGGRVRRLMQLCPTMDEPHRLELHVTADDPSAASRPKNLEPPFEPIDDDEKDRGVDEVIQFEVRLVPEGGLDPPSHRRAHAPHPRPSWGPFIEAGAAMSPTSVAVLLGGLQVAAAGQPPQAQVGNLPRHCGGWTFL